MPQQEIEREMGWGEWLAEAVLALLGIVMTLCWPLSWISWLPGMSVVVLGTAVGSAVLYCLIYWLKGPAPEEVGLTATKREDFWGDVRLPDLPVPGLQAPRAPRPAPQFRITWKS